MARDIIFDAGPIISLTSNNLLWLLAEFKNKYDAGFYITAEVKKELVDNPLETKKFKFEALQVMYLIRRGILGIISDSKINILTNKLLERANKIFKAHAHWISIVQRGEMSVLSGSCFLGAETIVIDERTTRLLIENPERLKNILTNTLHTEIYVNKDNLMSFKEMTCTLKPIRSVELVSIAYEFGILDRYLPNTQDAGKTLLESVLWGVKLSGCAVSKEEIEEILKIESKRYRNL